MEWSVLLGYPLGKGNLIIIAHGNDDQKIKLFRVCFERFQGNIHGGPIRPQNHWQSRKHTWSDQIAMKLAGEVKWVLLRVCKLFLFHIINIFVINLTF